MHCPNLAYGVRRNADQSGLGRNDVTPAVPEARRPVLSFAAGELRFLLSAVGAVLLRFESSVRTAPPWEPVSHSLDETSSRSLASVLASLLPGASRTRSRTHFAWLATGNSRVVVCPNDL